MSRMYNVALPVALLFSALVLSSCASKPTEVVAEPAPVAVEQAAAPEESAPSAVAEQAEPAPVVAAEQEMPKPAVKKHKRARKKVAKVAPAPAPVAAPEPVVEPAPVVQEEAPPAPAPVTVAPVQQPAEPGFLQRYWLFFLAIILVIIGAFFLMRNKD